MGKGGGGRQFEELPNTTLFLSVDIMCNSCTGCGSGTGMNVRMLNVQILP